MKTLLRLFLFAVTLATTALFAQATTESSAPVSQSPHKALKVAKKSHKKHKKKKKSKYGLSVPSLLAFVPKPLEEGHWPAGSNELLD